VKYDHSKMIKDFTAMDNDILEKISKIDDLSKIEKDVLTSLCRQIFYTNKQKVVRTSWWGAADVTAKAVGCSERTVRRVYEELVKRNIIQKQTRTRGKNINGQAISRQVNWITINTDTSTWKVSERASYKSRKVATACAMTKVPTV
jgi:hypothetical protein